MSNTERRKILNYRNANGLSPNPNNIDYGEIAIGYKKDKETIYIKNTTNEIVDFTPISIVNLTYNELKNLRDNSKLKPSQYYRITDFVTTVANDPEARSAGHPFDIIVLALDKNKLHEECHAIQHEGDTYFANCNLAAWKIWYCLDNNTTKYMWADATNGKGVIYHMIDEWGNDCPYDFKNVQFKRYAVEDASPNGELARLHGTYIGYNSDMTRLNIPDQNDFIWMYTFSLHKENEYVDYSSNCLYGPFTEDISYFNSPKHGQCVYNTLSNTYGSVNIDGQFYVSLILNNIVLISVIESLWGKVDFPTEMIYNTFGTANFNMTLQNNPEGNKFGNKCYNNIVGGIFNSFGNGCNSNSFGNDCNYNSFGNDCFFHLFGNDCYANSFGDKCYANWFGNDCHSNSFGDWCSAHSFGNECNYNSFGNWCDNNSFGNMCDNNSFGNMCHANLFGNNCDSNSFGNECSSNSFVDDFKYNALGNDVQYIIIEIDKIYHTQILNGTQGVYNNDLTIQFTPETTYSQFAGLTSDGVLKIWVEADDIVNLTYNELKNLRDNSKLKPSQYYRITDFVTTVANDPEARSAGHPFDIIVVATSPNTLNENAKVVKHEGDTYFANSNLDAWELKYDLDNDKSKYAWADETNGKGVIYYMKDEFNNECPYDFKNVLFKRYKLKDQSGLHLADYTSGDLYYGKVINQAFKTLQNILGTSINSNNISLYYTKGVYYDGYLVSGSHIYNYDSSYESYDKRKLVFNGNSGGNYVGLCNIYDSFDIIAEVEDTNGEWFYTFSKKATATDAAVDASLSKLTNIKCYCNSIKKYIDNGIYYLNNNIFIVLDSTGDIYNNNFNTHCYNNTFGNNCNSNTFGNGCKSITFGNGCKSITFGNNCDSNTFGNNCDSNTFENYCKSITFGNYCNFNTFGNGCNYNTFGNGCNFNTFGNGCNSITFGNNCSSNTFENYCHYNTFGNGCNFNTFGNNCDSNTFGNNCDSNTFGNGCKSITFGNYYYYNKIKSGNNGISFELYTTGSSMKIRYLTIYKVNDNITIPANLITLNANYSQVLGLNSSGGLVCKPALD